MLEAIPPLSDAHQWWPSGSGIYFWIHTMDKPEVDFLDLRTSQIRRIYVPHTLPTPWLAGLSVSPDGKWLVYSRVDERFQDLMLVNNFR
jgi:Tol biopolymer transport system component